MLAFGIEEEFLLMDPGTGRPRPVGPQIRARLSPGLEHGFSVSAELLACQVELATPVCLTRVEATESLSALRSELSGAATQLGVLAAGIGAIFDPGNTPAVVTDTERYRGIQRNAPALIADQYVTGAHVHVQIEDPELRVQVMNRCRPWLPVLTALAANSPYWRGQDSGFASWRSILYRRWPIHGAPPVFADLADYRERVAKLLISGVAMDAGHVAWLMRLSATHPTLELRCADSQLRAGDTLLLACLFRALVATEIQHVADGLPLPAYPPEHIDIAIWRAARHGLSAHLIDLETAELLPAGQQLHALYAYTADALGRFGEEQIVRGWVARVGREGNGAQRQRLAMQRSRNDWVELLQASLTEIPDER